MFNLLLGRTPEQLNDAAISLLREHPSLSRVPKAEPPKAIMEALSLIRKGSAKAAYTDRMFPILHYNYAVCLYHLGVPDWAQFHFALAIKQSPAALDPEEELRLHVFFCTFLSIVVADLHKWWAGGFLFDPDWLIEAASSIRQPPVNRGFSRATVNDFVSHFIRDCEGNIENNAPPPTFLIRSDDDLL
jgi:hypothetical protein